MADTYYDSELTGEEIEATLNAINGVIAQTNNGKVLAIENGKIVAKSVSEWIDPHILEPLTVTENGDYYPEGDVDGFDEVHVNVPGETPVLEHLSVTANGTYTPEIGVDGFDEVTVSVPSSGTNVYYGDEDPASSLGEDGDIYIKYGSSVTEINGIYVDSEYIVSNTTQILSVHSDTFRKSFADPCIAIEMYSGYYGPMLLSPTADGAKYNRNPSPYEITVDGKTWYLSTGEYWTATKVAPTIQEYYDEPIDISTAGGRINTARLMLRLASENIYVSKVFKKIGSIWELLLKETVLQAKTTTVNGIVRADAGYDGLSSVNVNVQATGNVYTNTGIAPSTKINDVSQFTKLYDASKPFGGNGSKVATRLGITDESSHSTLQAGGWSASGMCYYDSENQIGAYAGYAFNSAKKIGKVKLWINRYSGQNANLTVTVEYMDAQSEWHEIQDLTITTNLAYPSKIFEVTTDASIDMYGIRWIHKKQPQKYGGNNITFAGMTVYEVSGEIVPCYTPSETGLIYPPAGYDGFGPLYIPEA